MPQNKILLGNCLDKLKELENNSVDSIITDPPYELGFMGKSWDNTGIANNKDMWAECLRVLKPGGHLLAFSGTRTYHRMACAIEDAGFEVRDMIEWVYGSGFPKSLNIGKAVDKLQGNERELVGEHPYANRGTAQSKQAVNLSGSPERSKFLDKGTSEWEGWGTALKPAHEPIVMARKPLGQQELDIAKNICYNITEKGLITNSKIIWRIKNVKGAEKQKMSNYSTPTQLQKTVEVSAEFVEMKGNESVGKKIQKLIDSICESGIQETGNKPEKQVLKAISKTKIEYQDTGENINTNEKQKLLKHTEESASVVENQDLSSLPLTTLEVAEDSTEKKSKTETSMSSLKSTDTQKTDIDCSAQTATSQWVCMDIVRTLKVSFEGKEYDFIELSDGSLVWNENLEPYRKQQKLNVAENCLKYGTGGINIDESRVAHNEPEWHTTRNPRNKDTTFSSESCGFNSENTTLASANSAGRFPANLIHDNSEEVRECFPETKTGAVTQKAESVNSEYAFSHNMITHTKERLADSGNASRFFKSIPIEEQDEIQEECTSMEEKLEKLGISQIEEKTDMSQPTYKSILYQAKASKSERNKGCENMPLQHYLKANKMGGEGDTMLTGSGNPRDCRKHNNHPTVKPIALMEYLIKMVTHKGGIVLDPFAGSGSTLVAAKQNGYQFIGIEMTPEYIPIIEARTGVKAEEISLEEQDKIQEDTTCMEEKLEELKVIPKGLSKCCNAKVYKGYCEMCCEKV